MSRPLPPLNAVKAFEAFARHGSLTSAAAELGVTHGAVGRQIRALEDWLGLRLAARSGRGLSLTGEGQAYARMATAALEALAEGTEALRTREGANRLRVSTTNSIANRLLLPRLGEFSERHPRIEVWVSVDPRLTDFADGHIDVALRMGAGPWPGLHAVPWLMDRLLPLCSPAYRAAHLGLAEPPDIARCTLLHDRDPEAQWSRWFRAHGLKALDPTPGPRFAGSDLVLDAALRGHGVALGRETLAADDIATGRLVPALPHAVDLGAAYWIVTPRAAPLRQKVRVFVDWLLESATTTAGLTPAAAPTG